jgi:RNA 3'-terminal phosphate cyclase (ATP)
MSGVRVDGSFGEGGGQVLRTSLALAALTGRLLMMENIRAGRRRPGLRPQHLTAVRAAAAVCRAQVEGDALDSLDLSFRPTGPPIGGVYRFDVREAAQGGSAGSMTLIAQTLLLPLSYAKESSRLVLAGGTHVPWSPSFHFLDEVFLPAARRAGLDADVELRTWGWYPVGGGEFDMSIRPTEGLRAMAWGERGELRQVTGVAAVTNLPSHIPQRMANRAMNLLREAGIPSRVEALRERGPGPGAGIWLTADYEMGPAGFSALGERGKPAERVAEESVERLLRHHRAGKQAAVDPHLADQLIVPLALADGESVYGTSEITAHTTTNVHIVRQFVDTRIDVQRTDFGGVIHIEGVGYRV